MRRTLTGLVVVVVLILGVACTPSPPPDLVAVAYINLDGINGYDADEDRLIAKLIDNDGAVDGVGGAVVTYSYPRDLLGNTFGHFTVTTHGVDGYGVGGGQALAVGNDPLNPSGFEWKTDLAGNGVELYREGGGINWESQLLDSHNSVDMDTIDMNPASPSEPGIGVFAQWDFADGDDRFIDVDVLPF